MALRTKKQITITIDIDLYEKLEELCDVECRTVSGFISLLLRRFFEENKFE